MAVSPPKPYCHTNKRQIPKSSDICRGRGDTLRMDNIYHLGLPLLHTWCQSFLLKVQPTPLRVCCDRARDRESCWVCRTPQNHPPCWKEYTQHLLEDSQLTDVYMTHPLGSGCENQAVHPWDWLLQDQMVSTCPANVVHNKNNYHKSLLISSWLIQLCKGFWEGL